VAFFNPLTYSRAIEDIVSDATDMLRSDPEIDPADGYLEGDGDALTLSLAADEALSMAALEYGGLIYTDDIISLYHSAILTSHREAIAVGEAEVGFRTDRAGEITVDSQGLAGLIARVLHYALLYSAREPLINTLRVLQDGALTQPRDVVTYPDGLPS